MITVKLKGYGEIEVEKNSTLLDIIKELEPENYRRYLGAIYDQQVQSLTYPIKKPMQVELLDITTVWGYRIYTKTVSAIFVMACEELFKHSKVKLQHFLGSGLYAEFERNISISHGMISEIEKKMREIVEADIPIVKEFLSKEEIIEFAKNRGLDESVALYETTNKSGDEVHYIGEFSDIFQGSLAPSTGFVRAFALKYYFPGVLIVFPSFKNNYNINNYVEQKKLAKIFSEASEWAEIMGLAYLGSLNKLICSGEVGDVIRIAEALQEKKIMRIADSIKEDLDIRLVLISGPSSSGKTSFAHRLSIALKVNGLSPVTISMDDYFVNREDTPRKENGDYDFESIEAIDLAQLNRDLICLLEGEEVEIPKFDFKTGSRKSSGKVLKVDKLQPIIVEGIHGLNPALSLDIPDMNKYKIYISALTQLNIDAHNRIPTTDTRLLRRLVRDYQFRGFLPERTFEIWEGVRKGEDVNIFPYQENADVMFNSALAYELGVLKKYAIPLLQLVDKNSPWHMESVKLLHFLSYFKDIDQDELIPNNSILREFIGGSTFDVH